MAASQFGLNQVQKIEFIKVLLEQEVLQFGSFRTKSGRDSPFFFNTGKVDSGAALAAWSGMFANVLETLRAPIGTQDVHLYGPAYKGIPLSVGAAMVYQSRHPDAAARFSFNRKEKKKHGEGGIFVGAPLVSGDRIIIVEDVLTGGTSLRETAVQLAEHGVRIEAAIVGIDRQEKGNEALEKGLDLSARAEIEKEFGFKIHSLVNLDGIVETLYGKEFLDRVWIDEEMYQAIQTYRKQYGSK